MPSYHMPFKKSFNSVLSHHIFLSIFFERLLYPTYLEKTIFDHILNIQRSFFSTKTLTVIHPSFIINLFKLSLLHYSFSKVLIILKMYKSILFILALILSTCSASFKRSIYAGRATWFDTSVGIGACGQQSSNSDHIVALNSAQYHSGAHCYSKIRIHNHKSGAIIEASIFDECPTCNWGDLDLTPDTFKAIANLDDGIAEIRWYFI